MYGNGTSGNEWKQIAQHVGTRTYNQIKLHAHKYFIKLQQATNVRVQGEGTETTPADVDDGNWSLTEDLIFENALARYEESVPGRWELIAKMLPGKTADDALRRYQKLLFDIARIENGEEVELKYKTRKEEGGGALVPKEGDLDAAPPLDANVYSDKDKEAKSPSS